MPDQRGLVGSIIIQHQVKFQVGGYGRIDLLQKVEKLDRAVTAIALAENVAGGDVERGKQTGNARC